MKKIIASGIVLAILAACGSNDSSKKEEGKGETVVDNSSNPDYKKGLALIAGDDCLTCHKVDELLTGPSYRDIANKYSKDDNAVPYLADKIIKGGSGVWGEAIMTPHAGLSKEDAEAMAKYIMLLKNK